MFKFLFSLFFITSIFSSGFHIGVQGIAAINNQSTLLDINKTNQTPEDFFASQLKRKNNKFVPGVGLLVGYHHYFNDIYAAFEPFYNIFQSTQKYVAVATPNPLGGATIKENLYNVNKKLKDEFGAQIKVGKKIDEEYTVYGLLGYSRLCYKFDYILNYEDSNTNITQHLEQGKSKGSNAYSIGVGALKTLTERFSLGFSLIYTQAAKFNVNIPSPSEDIGAACIKVKDKLLKGTLSLQYSF